MKNVIVSLLLLSTIMVSAQEAVEFKVKYSQLVAECSNEGCNYGYLQDPFPIELVEIKKGRIEDVAVYLYNMQINFFTGSPSIPKYCNNKNFKKCNWVKESKKKIVSMSDTKQGVIDAHAFWGGPGKIYEKDIASLNRYFDKHPNEKTAYLKRSQEYEKNRLEKIESAKKEEAAKLALAKKEEEKKIKKQQNEFEEKVKSIRNAELSSEEILVEGVWTFKKGKKVNGYYSTQKYQYEYDCELSLEANRDLIFTINIKKYDVLNINYPKLITNETIKFKGVWNKLDEYIIFTYIEYEVVKGYLESEEVNQIANQFKKFKVLKVGNRKVKGEVNGMSVKAKRK